MIMFWISYDLCNNWVNSDIVFFENHMTAFQNFQRYFEEEIFDEYIEDVTLSKQEQKCLVLIKETIDIFMKEMKPISMQITQNWVFGLTMNEDCINFSIKLRDWEDSFQLVVVEPTTNVLYNLL